MPPHHNSFDITLQQIGGAAPVPPSLPPMIYIIESAKWVLLRFLE